MQPTLDGPRAALNPHSVISLISDSASVKIESGLEVYNSDLTLAADISGNLQDGSSVSSDCTAQIHRSCTLVLDSDAPFNYMSQFVKPYMTMTDEVTGFQARFNLGVYTLASPTPDLTLSPPQSVYTGYDLLQVLNQPIGDSYEVAAGNNPIAKAQALIASIFPAATFEADSNSTLTDVTYSWPLDSSNQFTYLSVVNSLLGLVGFANLWVDWDGVFQMRKWVDPNDPNTGVEWTFDLTTATGAVVNESRSTYQDLFDVPNQWVFVMNNLDAAPSEGTTQFTFTDNITPVTSVASRGRVIRKVIFVDVIDYPSLVLAGVQFIEQDLQPTEAFAILTWPIPLFWHRDVVAYIDPALGSLPPILESSRKCLVQSWQLPLDVASGDMQITLLSTSGATTSAAN